MKLIFALASLVTLAAARVTNDTALYKNPNATVEARVSDLLKRMTVQEKMSQLIQGDMRNYINLTDGSVNRTGLEWTMEYRGHAVWTGLYAEMEIVKKSAKIAQDYLVNETRLGESLCNWTCIEAKMVRNSGIHTVRRSTRYTRPQWHHLQLSHCHGLCF